MATEFPTFVDTPEGETPEPGTPLVDADYLNSVNLAVNTLENTLPGKADSGSLATVATSGAYDDLVGTPFIPDSADDINAQPADADLTAIAGLSPSNDDVIQRKSGAWTNRTPAQLKTDLALAKGDVGLGNVANAAQVQLGTVDAAGDLIVGSAADTVARLGVGTDGQVLTANSEAELGVEWADPTGGGGGGGFDASIIDAKGDLIAGTAADTADNLAVGTDGQVLAADSDATTGLAWVDANDHTHEVTDLNITGTPDGTKFLRDDGTWAAPSTLALTRTVAYASSLTIDPTTPGNRINITATGDISSLAVSGTGALDGQVLQLIILASAASRSVTFASSLRTTTGISRGPYTVPSGQILRAAVEYSTLTSAWAILAVTVTAA